MEKRSQRAGQQIIERIKNYEALLEGGKSLFFSLEQVDRKTWDAYVNGLELKGRFPGLEGLGVIFRVPRSEREKFEAAQRVSGFPDFRISPPGERPYYDVITYLKRIDRGILPIGFDISTEPVRREAAEQAANADDFAITGRVITLQTRKPGFSLFLPISPHQPSQTPFSSTGKIPLEGWVYGSIQMEKLLEGIQDPSQRLDFEIYDGGVRPDSLLFRTFDEKSHSHGPKDFSLQVRVPLEVGGRKWILQFFPTKSFYAAVDSSRPLLVLTFGVLISLVLFWILRSMAAAKIRAERSLVSSRGYLSQIIHSIPTLLCSISLGGSIRFVNPAVTRLTLFSDQELWGRPWTDFFRPLEDGGRLDRIFRKFSDNSLISLETSLVTRTGVKKVIQWDLCQRLDENMRPLEVVAIGTDITERKKLEEMKDEFISTVSHELRTPLMSLGGALQLLKDGRSGQWGKEDRSLLQMALRNSDRLERLINDLLDVERLASDKLSFRMSHVDLAELIRNSVESNAGYAKKLGVQFAPDEPLEHCRVLADPDRLMQVMANLLSNAAKFSPPGEKVGISMERRNGKIRVGIRDRGRGIPKEFLSRIFHRFAQAPSSEARLKGGTGLGLYISKEIVERHGGNIGFQSEEGKGTEFYFELPLLAEKTESSRESVLEQRKTA